MHKIAAPSRMQRLLLPTVVALLLTPVATAQDGNSPFEQFTTDWRRAAAWNDGQAECAVYDATRDIYGQPRRYTARLFTNTEHASPETFTKSSEGAGRHAFKHHLREDIPTDNYTYHYSTMAYVGVDDLKSLKLDMGSQEDCGTTFKQYVNHAAPGSPTTLRWRQFSYFPNEGHKAGESQPATNFVFQDALSLVLRGYPFENPPDSMTLRVLPDQTENEWTPHQAEAWVVEYVGMETLNLPIGEVEAHHVRAEPRLSGEMVPPHDYWFAVEGDHVEGEPSLHIMVRYEGPNGQTYQLREVERCAYWEQ